MDPTPRMLISPGEPGSPVVVVTRTPVNLPANALSRDSFEPDTISSALTAFAEPVKEAF